MRHCFGGSIKPERNTMKKLILVAALVSVFAASALAEDDSDQAFGKHDMGPSPDSSMNRPNSATGTVDEGRFINRAPGTTIGSAPMGAEREINRSERRERMLPERAAPDATEDAPAGH
jgi:hypothetical protein